MNLALPSVTNLRDVARSLGWQQNPSFAARRLFVLENPTFARRQIVLPMDDDASDAMEAVQAALQKLAALHKLDPERLGQRARHSNDDLWRIALPIAATSLPLDFAARMLSSLKTAVLAAATTAIQPRMHHPRLGMALPQKVLDASRFGHTESGSFSLKVFCPVLAAEGDSGPDLPQMLGSGEWPLARRAMVVLHQSLTRLIDAIEVDDLAPLEAAADEGAGASSSVIVSSNLCDAISNLHDDDLDNPVEFDFDWAPRLAVPEILLHRPRIRLQAAYFPRIAEVASALRKREQPIKGAFAATVEELAGEVGEDGRRYGDVVCRLFIDGEAVRARITLNADQYQVAMDAHASGPTGYVSVQGELRAGREPRLLRDLTRFEPLRA